MEKGRGKAGRNGEEHQAVERRMKRRGGSRQPRAGHYGTEQLSHKTTNHTAYAWGSTGQRGTEGVLNALLVLEEWATNVLQRRNVVGV